MFADLYTGPSAVMMGVRRALQKSPICNSADHSKELFTPKHTPAFQADLAVLIIRMFLEH